MKKTVLAKNSRAQLGYMEVGGIDPDGNLDKAPDLKERFYMGREPLPAEPEHLRGTAGQSQWPADDALPGFTGFMKPHIVKLYELALRLSRAFALSLYLPESHFISMFQSMGTTLAFNYYPPVPTAKLDQFQWSFSPHTDYGAFTILLQDMTGGLEVRNAEGKWIPVPPLAGSFVINIGDLFATWTNDLFTSNLHRAFNTAAGPRISMPFFVQPSSDTEISCLETCCSAENPPKYRPVNASRFVDALVQQAHSSGRAGYSERTLARLKKNPDTAARGDAG